jgi:hypothetical protein
VFAVGFLANSIMIGANRVGYFGVDFGQQLYYVQAPAYLFLLCVGAAFSVDASSALAVTHQEVSARRRTPAHHRPPSRRVRVLWLAAGVAAVGLYAVAFVTSATTMNVKDPSNEESVTARSYFTTLLGQIDTASSHGAQVSVLDNTVPVSIVASAFAPWNHLLFALPVVGPDISVDQLSTKTFEVTSSGGLVPVAFHRTSGSSRGLPVAAVIGSSGAHPAPALAGADEQCFTSTRPGGTINIRLVSPLTTPAAWLLLGLSARSGGSVTVSTLDSGAPAPTGTLDLKSSGDIQNYLLPLSPRSLDQVELSAATAGTDVCVSSVDVGTFSPSGNGH